MALDILHVHSTFALGGKEARAVRLMNAFGDHARHTILSAVPNALGARDAIAPGIAAHFPRDHPPIVGKPAPGRYRDLARYMRRFDLVLTYNWGAMDAVGARRLFGGTPLIHHEDGFNQDEAVRQKTARVWFRRLTLPAAHAVVVPSERLERIAHEAWGRRALRIANGIAVDRYAWPVPGAIPGLDRRPGEIVVGTLAGLRAVKNLPRLVRAVAPLPQVRLVIVGEGPERAAIQAEATRLGIADRVHLPGFLPDPARYVGLFDIFALSSDSEQFPISLIEAMAAGRPVVSTDVGDVCTMVALANRRLIVPVDDEAEFAAALARLADDRGMRIALGTANLEKAQADYGEAAMIDAYRRLYGRAAGAAGFFREKA